METRVQFSKIDRNFKFVWIILFEFYFPPLASLFAVLGDLKMAANPWTLPSPPKRFRRNPPEKASLEPPPGQAGRWASAGIALSSRIERLPTELAHHLFEFMDFKDLGNLALANKTLRKAVAGYVPTKACLAKVCPPALAVQGDANIRVEQESVATMAAALEVVAQHALPPAKVKEDRRRKKGERSTEANTNILDKNKLTALKKHPKPWPVMAGFAVLVKRLTALQSTHERLVWAFRVFDSALEIGESAAADKARKDATITCHLHGRFSPWPAESCDWRETLRTLRMAAMMHTFTLGWDNSELPAVVRILDGHYGLTDALDRASKASDNGDVNVCAEMRMRLVIRAFSWEMAGEDYAHRAHWLISFAERLVGNNVQKQAILFYMAFGPACPDGDHLEDPDTVCVGCLKLMGELNNHADWTRFASETPVDFHEGKEMFYNLAQAVCCCMTAVKAWAERSMVDVLDGLFSSFEQGRVWKRENVAGFLLFCSEKLILEYLRAKLVAAAGDDEDTYGEVHDVGQRLIDMIVMSYRFDNDMTAERGIGKIFDAICQRPPAFLERSLLFKCIWHSLCNEFEESEMDADDEDLIDVMASLGGHVMKRAYVHLDQKKKEEGIKCAELNQDTPDTLPVEDEDMEAPDDEVDEDMEEPDDEVDEEEDDQVEVLEE